MCSGGSCGLCGFYGGDAVAEAGLGGAQALVGGGEVLEFGCELLLEAGEGGEGGGSLWGRLAAGLTCRLGLGYGRRV